MRFGRSVQVTVRNQYRQISFDSSAFRITFDVRHKLGSKEGTIGKVEIFNLSANTEDDLLVRNTECEVVAGYRAVRGLIYKGTILRVERGRAKVDRYLRIHLRTGLPLEGTIRLALGGVNSARTAVRTIVQSLENRPPFENIILVESSLNLIPANATVSSWSFTGPARLALDELMSGIPPVDGLYRLSWNLKGSHLYIISTNKEREFLGTGEEGLDEPQDRQLLTLSESNGMLGLPEQLESGIRVRSLLIPGAEVDNLLEIKPPENVRNADFPTGTRTLFYADKQWRVVDVRHAGDSWGGDYYTEFEARELD